MEFYPFKSFYFTCIQVTYLDTFSSNSQMSNSVAMLAGSQENKASLPSIGDSGPGNTYMNITPKKEARHLLLLFLDS